jgi:putative membrane protein
MLKTLTTLAAAGALIAPAHAAGATPALDRSSARVAPGAHSSALATATADGSVRATAGTPTSARSTAGAPTSAHAAVGTLDFARAALSAQDRAFLRAAHQTNLAEIAGGRIAERRGRTPEVRALGARFIRDHTAMDADLTRIAGDLGVRLPQRPNEAQRKRAAQYESFEAERFDILYVLTQLVGHQAAMADGDREIKEGRNPQVRRLAVDAAPVVASHHRELLRVRELLQP